MNVCKYARVRQCALIHLHVISLPPLLLELRSEVTIKTNNVRPLFLFTRIWGYGFKYHKALGYATSVGASRPHPLVPVNRVTHIMYYLGNK